MKASLTKFAVGLITLIAVGCSGTRDHVCQSTQATTDYVLPVVATRSLESSSHNDQATQHSIRTVAYQEDEAENESSDAALLAPPVESDDDSGAADDIVASDSESSISESTNEDTVSGLTLEAFEQMALQNNPSILQSSAAANKASGIRTQVGLKPNPTIGYFGEEIGNEGAGGLQGAFVSQTFVRGNKLALNQHVLDHDIQSVLWQVEAQRYRVRTDIQTRFYAALAAQERIKLAQEFRVVAEKGVQVAEDRMEAAVGTRPDILQSEIQVNEVELAIQRAEFEFEAAWKELAAVAGVPDLPPSTILGSLDSNVPHRDSNTAFAQIVAQSPLLLSAHERVKRARANVQRQQAQATPNVTGQLGAGHDNATGDEFVNVQLSLPLQIHNKNQGNIHAAHAEFCEATQNVKRLEMQIRQSLAGVMRNYKTSAATVQRYEQTIIPKAEETLELILKAQEAGEIDFLRVLTARRMFFDVNLQYVSALAQLSQANARIDGLLLTGGLSNVVTYNGGDDLRGQRWVGSSASSCCRKHALSVSDDIAANWSTAVGPDTVFVNRSGVFDLLRSRIADAGATRNQTLTSCSRVAGNR